MVIFYKKGDLQIQQMAFMLLFVFIFFAMAGLFFVMFYSKDLKSNYQSSQIDLAISSLETIANMPELNCDSQKSFCLDEDKLLVFASNSQRYAEFWPVSYIKVRKLYPTSSEQIRCPNTNCTYYEVYDSKPTEIIGRDTFVSICKRVAKPQGVSTECTIGKLEVGVKLRKA
jgi:hypothetical protein